VSNIALEGNLYTIDGPQNEPDDVIERALAEYFDGPASQLLQTISAKKCPRRGTTERQLLSDFLAIQLARTPDSIGRIMFASNVVDYASSPPISFETMRQYLSEVHFAAVPDDDEVKAAADLVNGMTAMGSLPSKEDSLDILFRVALRDVSPILQEKAWSIEIDPRGQFITSDLPVNKYWAPNKCNDYEGIGVENADEIRFPVDPRHLLVLRPRYPEHRVVVDEKRVRSANRGTAARCYRFVVAHVDQEQLIGAMPLRDHAAVLRFQEGPLVDATGVPVKPRRDVIHTYVSYEEE